MDAITFRELVEHGKINGSVFVEGVPWSFDYKGFPVSHENDECYLITSNTTTHRMTPSDMFCIDCTGEEFVCEKTMFDKLYRLTSKTPRSTHK